MLGIYEGHVSVSKKPAKLLERISEICLDTWFSGKSSQKVIFDLGNQATANVSQMTIT